MEQTISSFAFNVFATFILIIRHMVQTEGFRSLYKGLGPNLIGVAPAR